MWGLRYLIPNHHKLSNGPAEAQLHSDWSMEPGTRVMPGSSTKYDRLQITDFRFQISDFRLQITDYRLQISDFRFLISNLKSLISKGVDTSASAPACKI